MDDITKNNENFINLYFIKINCNSYNPPVDSRVYTLYKTSENISQHLYK